MKGGDIDLVLTDVVMPVLSGRDLAARLAQLRPSLKVLYMSGYSSNIIANHGILEEGSTLVEKPFSPEAACAEGARGAGTSEVAEQGARFG